MTLYYYTSDGRFEIFPMENAIETMFPWLNFPPSDKEYIISWLENIISRYSTQIPAIHTQPNSLKATRHYPNVLQVYYVRIVDPRRKEKAIANVELQVINDTGLFVSISCKR